MTVRTEEQQAETERLLRAALLWLLTICEVGDIDPDETTMKVVVDPNKSRAEAVLAVRTLSETLVEINTLLTELEA